MGEVSHKLLQVKTARVLGERYDAVAKAIYEWRYAALMQSAEIVAHAKAEGRDLYPVELDRLSDLNIELLHADYVTTALGTSPETLCVVPS